MQPDKPERDEPQTELQTWVYPAFESTDQAYFLLCRTREELACVRLQTHRAHRRARSHTTTLMS